MKGVHEFRRFNFGMRHPVYICTCMHRETQPVEFGPKQSESLSRSLSLSSACEHDTRQHQQQPNYNYNYNNKIKCLWLQMRAGCKQGCTEPEAIRSTSLTFASGDKFHFLIHFLIYTPEIINAILLKRPLPIIYDHI